MNFLTFHSGNESGIICVSNFMTIFSSSLLDQKVHPFKTEEFLSTPTVPGYQLQVAAHNC